MLSLAQKELFLNSGLGLVEYNALKIELVNVRIPLDQVNYIFTSKNAVNAFLEQARHSDASQFNAFCVGEKTKALLETNGVKVLEMAQNALDLAEIIAKKHQHKSFLFLCGNKRRDELPETLTKNNVQYKELEVYRTHLNSKAFQRNFDGILFFIFNVVDKIINILFPMNSIIPYIWLIKTYHIISIIFSSFYFI